MFARLHLFVFILSCMGSASFSHGQTTYTWTGTSTDSWLNPANWSSSSPGTYAGNSAAAGSGASTDIALFNNATSSIGIDIAAANTTLQLGALNFQSATSLLIGNSSGTAGLFRLNGSTINNTANVVIAMASSAGNLTIANQALGGTSTMGLRLGSANSVIQVFGSSQVLTVNSILSGSSNLALMGPGRTIFTNTNTYAGDTTIYQGVLEVTGANGVMSGNFGTTTIAHGGTLQLSNSVASGNNTNRITRPVVMNFGNLRFQNSTTDALSYSEATQGVTVTGGQLSTISSTRAASGQTSTLTFDSLARTAGGYVHFVGDGLGDDTRNRILLTAAPALNGSLSVSGGGLIGGWATYNVTTTTANFASYSATNGITAMQNVNSSLNPSDWTSNHNIKVNLDGNTPLLPSGASPTAINSLTILTSGGSTDADNFWQNGGAIRIATGGVLMTSTASSHLFNFASSTTLTAGQTAGTGGELNFNIHGGGKILVQSSITNNAGAVVSINKVGTGRLIFEGAITATGVLSISSTVDSSGVEVNNGLGLGNLSSVVLRASPANGNHGSVLQLAGGLSSAITQPITLETFQTGGNSTAISTDAPSLDLRSSIVSLGNNTLSSGNLSLGGNHFAQLIITGSSNTLTVNSSVVQSGTFTGSLLVKGGGTVLLNNAVTLPSGSIAVQENSTVRLPANTVNVLGLNPQQGTIILNGNNFVTSSAALSMGQNGTSQVGILSMNGFNQTFSAILHQAGSLAASSQIIQNGAGPGLNSTLTMAGSGAASVYGGILRDNATAGQGQLNLTITAGSLSLTGTNSSYTGVTNFNGGTLSAASIANGGVNSSLGAAPPTASNLVFRTGTLSYTGASASTNRAVTMLSGFGGGTIHIANPLTNLTMSGNHDFGASITKSGPGTLTFSSASTGNANTLVIGGTLVVNNTTGVGTGTGTITLNNGTTLMGTGRIGGGLNVNTGATLSPGTSIGTLSANAGLTTWAAGGRYRIEYNLDGGGPFLPGVHNDYFNSLGNLNLTATAGNEFVIDLRSIGTSINPSNSTSLTIATFNSLSSTFNPASDQNKFSYVGDFVGTPTLSISGNNLVLNFVPVPEPLTILAWGSLSAWLISRRIAKKGVRRSDQASPC